MRRRDLLAGLAGAALASGQRPAAARALERVRPGAASWPDAGEWARLRREVEGNLLEPTSLYGDCPANIASAACQSVLPNLRNPFYIGDQPGGTQVSGWLDAWQPSVSPYAVAAHSASDVAAAVKFAARHNLRVAVKGGGHSYQGTSNAPDSLLIWLHPMRAVTLHSAFAPEGGGEPVRAVSLEAGALWIDAYEAVTTNAGLYVQGGGCTTVGVAGHIQSGGFGSFSKRFGMSSSNLIEAEVVTADGRVRVCNARRDSDLFWALKGGGGGSFGVVTRATVRSHDLPANFGWAEGKIKAKSDAAFQRLIAAFMQFYKTALFNPNWGEHVAIQSGNTLELSLVSQGLSEAEANHVWAPFLAWIAASPQDYAITDEISIGARPAQLWWDSAYHRAHGDSMLFDPRPGASPHNAWWRGDREQVSAFLYGYDSIWLPQALLDDGPRDALARALFDASRAKDVQLHFNKGLAGAPDAIIAAARDTAMNPDVLSAFALAIIADGGPPPYLNVPGFPYDDRAAHADAAAIARATSVLRALAPDGGSYVSESNYFNDNWRVAFWGPHYERLRAIKRRYDPDGMFIVHHGVGSEDWSADGFRRI
jgi:FAD/FMN-containing dehydrogenase